MSNLILNESQVAPEKLVILEERRQRVDNDPAAILNEEAQAARYLNHPYGRPIIGWEKEIAALTTEQVLDFYRRWYAPNNAILVVGGDISADELRPIAERTYGRINATTVPQRRDWVEPQQRAERRVALTDGRVRQPAWTRSWAAPSYRYGVRAHAYPLQVLDEIMGGGATSRLYRRLVVEQQIAVSASAYYEPSKRGPSNFVIAASPRPGVSLDQLEQAVAEIVRDVVKVGLTDDEVERAKRRMIADVVFARDSFSTAARLLGEALAIGQTTGDVEAWPERIEAVDRRQVEEAARHVLKDHDVTALLISGGKETTIGGEPSPSVPESSAIR